MNTKSRTRKILVILNGKVAGDDTLRTAIARQRAAGRSIEVRVTWENGDARRFVSETDKVDLLIAAGGDGTLNEVVHGLMDLSTVVRPVLGVVPLGTANDFATGCSIPRDPEKALALCLEGERSQGWFRRRGRIYHFAGTQTPAWPRRIHRDGCDSGNERSSISRKANPAGSQNHWQRPSGDCRERAPNRRRFSSRSSRTY